MKVVYTKTFDKSIHRVVDFLLTHTESSEEEAVNRVTGATQSFEKRVSDQPLSCQRCKEAEKLSVLNFREYHKEDYRVIYMTTENEVIALLFLHQRQNIQKSLIDHCLTI